MKAARFALPALLLLGCSGPSSGPGLLQLTELSAREVGRGDKLEISGAGFPEGRVARLTFRGDIFRPGRPAAHDVELSLAAQTLTPHLLEATISEELVRSSCGRDDSAHATFRGDVTAAFASRKSGAPPVAGTLQGVVLDIVPSRQSEQDRELAVKEGLRFAQFLGVELSADGSGPLRIQKVLPRSRAEQSGLMPGDVVEELSGVRVNEVSDFVPTPRARAARIGLHRGGVAEAAVVAVDVADFKPGTLSDLTPPLALVGSAILALLLALSPLGRFSSWLGSKLSTRARAENHERYWLSFARGISSALPSGAAAFVGVAVASSLLAFSAFGVPLVARELDLPILLFASASALLVAGFLSQILREGRPSLRAGARRAFWVLLMQVPVASALLVSVLSVGSLRADDLAAAQAGMPWRFLAFASPIHFVALLLGTFALVPEGTLLSSPSSSLPRRESERSPALAAVEWAHLVLSAGLLAITLLGGFAVPWLSELDRTAVSGRLAIGALLLVVKTLGLVLFVATLRWALGRVSTEQCRGALLRMGLPSAVLLPVLTQLWTASSEGLVLSAYRGVIALALFVAATMLAALMLKVVGRNLQHERGESSVNPWI